MWGESVTAFVIQRSGKTLDIEQLKGFTWCSVGRIQSAEANRNCCGAT